MSIIIQCGKIGTDEEQFEQIGEFKYPEETKMIMIGRKNDNEISFDQETAVRYIYVDDKAVSSKHCNVQLHSDNGTAVITDESRNGTVILRGDGENVKIQKESKQVSFTPNEPIRIQIKTKANIYQLCFFATPSGSSNETEDGDAGVEQEDVNQFIQKQENNSIDAILEKDVPQKTSKKSKKVAVEQKEKESRPKKEPKAPKETKEKKVKESKEPSKKTEKGPNKLKKQKKAPKEEDLDFVDNTEDVPIKAPLPESSSGEFDEESSSSHPQLEDGGDSANEDSESSVKGLQNDQPIPKDAFCNVDLDFDPKEFLTPEALDEILAQNGVFFREKFFGQLLQETNEEQGTQDEKTETGVEDFTQQSFRKTYPMVMIPAIQDKNFYCLKYQIQAFDLCNKRVWVNGLSKDHKKVLEQFSAEIDEDYDPTKITCMITTEITRTSRFLIALISGIPIIDASTLLIPSNVKKAKNLNYDDLYCKLFTPSLEDVEKATKNSGFITQCYKKYSLPFVSALCQARKPICGYDFLILGEFSQPSEISDEDDLRFLISYGFYLNQLGAKVIILLDESKDKIIKKLDRNLQQSRQFKVGIYIIKVGSTLQERYDAFISGSVKISHSRRSLAGSQSKKSVDDHTIEDGAQDMQIAVVTNGTALPFDVKGRPVIEKDALTATAFTGTFVGPFDE